MLFENRYSRDIETAADCLLFPTSHPFEAKALMQGINDPIQQTRC